MQHVAALRMRHDAVHPPDSPPAAAARRAVQSFGSLKIGAGGLVWRRATGGKAVDVKKDGTPPPPPPPPRGGRRMEVDAAAVAARAA
jgi:hypothetical protein